MVDRLLLEGIEFERVLRDSKVSYGGQLETHPQQTYFASHVRYELPEVDNLAVDVDDVCPVSLRDDRSPSGRDGRRCLDQALVEIPR